MPQIQIDFGNIEDIDGYSIGHLTFSGNQKLVSTRDTAHHNCLVFISLTLLIDAIMQVLVNPNIKASSFNAVDDASFRLSFQKSHHKIMRTLYRKTIIDESSINDFKKQILSSLSMIYTDYEYIINQNQSDSALLDFVDSYKAFEQL